MRRPRFRKPTVSLALFPFLAVLVCTMGALFVLLVLVVQQARVYATVATESPPEPTKELAGGADELQRQADAFDWRRDILERQRTELTDKLADSRLQLGHLEDHIRRLEKKWEQLQASAAELERLSDDSDQTRAEMLSEQQRLQKAIEDARVELERLRNEINSQPRSFAIIPYVGPSGTKRRPIYVECTAQGITLQPEGVVLRAQDFDGPLGPGNPLDAALRATREHLTRLGTTKSDGEPYPLLVVRPDGAIAYNVARMAMKAWDDEFGYELIDADMQLKFPTPDPHLKQLLEKTVLDARDRQSALAAAMPSQFQGDDGVGFVASPGQGGFVPLGGGFSGQGSGGGGTSRRGGFTSFSERAGDAADVGQSTGSPSGADQATSPAGPNGSPNGTAGGASMSLSPAQARGKDWALPSSAANSTAVTRPIRVVCFPDRLEIHPARGETGPRRAVSIPHGLDASLDRFVNTIWQHVDQWGIAVAGGYWRPTLQVVTAPGGEPVAERLQVLLDNSGLDLQRAR